MAEPLRERVALGTAVFALIEPRPGHERDFNRWYERDHLFTLRVAPWTLAATRWVAPRALKALRIPARSAITAPATAGSYLTTAWIQAGGEEEHLRFAAAQGPGLAAAGRAFAERDHVHTARYRYLGGAFRDPDGVPAELALDRGYPGLVVTWIEREAGAPLEALAERLREELLPERLAGSPLAMSLVFAPLPRPPFWPAEIREPEGLGERLLLAHFLERDPRQCWEDHFADLEAELARAGAGRLLLAAPFLPARPGTDAYVDELR
jgi:hypothetical protein